MKRLGLGDKCGFVFELVQAQSEGIRALTRWPALTLQCSPCPGMTARFVYALAPDLRSISAPR